MSIQKYNYRTQANETKHEQNRTQHQHENKPYTEQKTPVYLAYMDRLNQPIHDCSPSCQYQNLPSGYADQSREAWSRSVKAEA